MSDMLSSGRNRLLAISAAGLVAIIGVIQRVTLKRMGMA